MGAVKIEELLRDLSAVLHVGQISATPPTPQPMSLSPSFPPPEITRASSNLGRTIFLSRGEKGRLGAARSVNATQINQRLTLTLVCVSLGSYLFSAVHAVREGGPTRRPPGRTT